MQPTRLRNHYGDCWEHESTCECSGGCGLRRERPQWRRQYAYRAAPARRCGGRPRLLGPQLGAQLLSTAKRRAGHRLRPRLRPLRAYPQPLSGRRNRPAFRGRARGPGHRGRDHRDPGQQPLPDGAPGAGRGQVGAGREAAGDVTGGGGRPDAARAPARRRADGRAYVRVQRAGAQDSRARYRRASWARFST